MGVGCHSRLVSSLRRALAAVAAALIFALCLFAASPALHGQLHHHGESTLDDGCAVMLFATGFSLPLEVAAPLPPAANRPEQRSTVSAEILLDSPRYLLLPGRGPPAA